jgi:hypothetical protein
MESKVGHSTNFLHWAIVSVQPEEIVRKIVLSARLSQTVRPYKSGPKDKFEKSQRRFSLEAY